MTLNSVSVFRGEVQITTSARKLSDVLPAQSHYWMLHNGDRYAKFGGNANATGILVFPDRVKAEKFKREVAFGLPFELKKVSVRVFIEEALKEGSVCTVDGLTVSVANITFDGVQP